MKARPQRCSKESWCLYVRSRWVFDIAFISPNWLSRVYRCALNTSGTLCSGQYMVGGARLKQHVNYNISCTLAILGTLVSSALRWDHGPSNAPHVEMQQLALDTLCRWRRQIFPSRDVMLHSRSNWPDSLHVPWPFASEQSLFNLRWLGLYPSPRRWSRLVPTRTSNQD